MRAWRVWAAWGQVLATDYELATPKSRALELVPKHSCCSLCEHCVLQLVCRWSRCSSVLARLVLVPYAPAASVLPLQCLMLHLSYPLQCCICPAASVLPLASPAPPPLLLLVFFPLLHLRLVSSSSYALPLHLLL